MTWGRPRLTEHRYDSPSARHRNIGVMRRRMGVLGVNAGRFPRMLAALDRAEERRFEVLYGYNPRCCQAALPMRVRW